MLLNHTSFEWSAAAPLTLRVRDTQDPNGATVDIEIDEEGRPLVCRAERPMSPGKYAAWSAVGTEFREWEGLRVASRLQATWHLPAGPFNYFREEEGSCANAEFSLRSTTALDLNVTAERLLPEY